MTDPNQNQAENIPANDNSHMHAMLKNLIAMQSQSTAVIQSMVENSDKERQERREREVARREREDVWRAKEDKQWAEQQEKEEARWKEQRQREDDRRIDQYQREDDYRKKQDEYKRADNKELKRVELWHRSIQVVIVALLTLLASGQWVKLIQGIFK